MTQEMPEIKPHDLILSSVNLYQMKFNRLFSDHLGHTVNDIANECGRGFPTEALFVHQLNPEAIDINKIRHYEAQSKDYEL